MLLALELKFPESQHYKEVRFVVVIITKVTAVWGKCWPINKITNFVKVDQILDREWMSFWDFFCKEKRKVSFIIMLYPGWLSKLKLVVLKQNHSTTQREKVILLRRSGYYKRWKAKRGKRMPWSLRSSDSVIHRHQQLYIFRWDWVRRSRSFSHYSNCLFRECTRWE